MGNAQVMTAKVAWDNACYWAITALLFFQRRLRQPGVHRLDRAADAPLLRPARADAAVLPRLGSRSTTGDYAHARAANVVDVAFLRRLQAGLGDPLIDDDALRRRLAANYALLEAFARTWQAIAVEQAPGPGARLSPTWPSGGAGRLDVLGFASTTGIAELS